MRRLVPTPPWVILLSLLGATAAAEPPPEQTVREVFVQIRGIADTDGDGSLSVAECKAMLSDRAAAERNCRFWDADKDGTITEDEYVARVRRVTGRRQ